MAAHGLSATRRPSCALPKNSHVSKATPGRGRQMRMARLALDMAYSGCAMAGTSCSTCGPLSAQAHAARTVRQAVAMHAILLNTLNTLPAHPLLFPRRLSVISYQLSAPTSTNANSPAPATCALSRLFDLK